MVDLRVCIRSVRAHSPSRIWAPSPLESHTSLPGPAEQQEGLSTSGVGASSRPQSEQERMSGPDFFPGEGLSLTLWRVVWVGLSGVLGHSGRYQVAPACTPDRTPKWSP